MYVNGLHVCEWFLSFVHRGCPLSEVQNVLELLGVKFNV